MNNLVYSDSLCELVVKEFTTQKVLFSDDGTGRMIKCKKQTYIWDDEDMVYYNDDRDDDYYMSIPSNGRKAFCLKLGYHARIKVTY